MINFFLSTTAILLFTTSLHFRSLAQNSQDFPMHIDDSYYIELKKQILKVLPNKENLVNPQYTSIPKNFMDTLLKYDWYEISSYYFYDKIYRSEFDDIDNKEVKYKYTQLDFTHYSSNGKMYKFNLTRNNWDKISKIEQPYTEDRLLFTLKKVVQKGNIYYMQKSQGTYNEDIEIISYKNGVLITCVKSTPTTNIKKFHNAYYGVRKLF
ncbi:MAG: hypothetical protein LC122_06165 [Chitinophagales bacterium]|nr:hypothetical protein [Chitinophagales bacterium]